MSLEPNNENTLKRHAANEQTTTTTEENEDDGWIGPMPEEQSATSKPKKQKGK